MTSFVQHGASYTRARGTIREMHYQAPPHTEVKVVRCLRGAIHDVIIDLGLKSGTFGAWKAVELTDNNRQQLYIPVGFAHGFQTLTDHVEVAYLLSEPHVPEASQGIRYDDPAFSIEWPLPLTAIASRDLAWPDFTGDGFKV